ncbi:MAG: leucine-rich repeat protein [Bacteroidales bacterium]|nr:leucine-rich repeat protein [Bacteroidales bacterium]
MIPLNISSSINQKHTKATADGFVDKDALGLFAVNYTDDNAVAGTLLSEGNQADNVKYVFDGNNFKWNPVKPVYYKDINTHADLYAYYPYQANIKDVNAAGFEVKKDQSAEATATALSGYEASDFLWGKAKNVTPVQSAIPIALSHKLSAVEVSLVEGTGFAEDEFASLEKSVILTSTTRKATIDYATGEATPLGGPQFDGIVMCPQEGGSWRAIVIPQAVAAGTQLFAITVNGVSYKFSQGNATEYQAGKQMTVDITVNKKTPSGDLDLTLADTQITDWTEDKNSHGGEARQYFVVNVEEPGTLGATIKSMGKNPDKIRNLKVVGNVRDDDFYFMRDSMAILEAVNMKESVVAAPHQQTQLVVASSTSNLYKIFCKALGKPDEIRYKYDGYWYDKGNIIPRDAFKDKQTLCYFCFPEYIEGIGETAFAGTKLSGSLVIPDAVELILYSAFSGTNIGNVSFPNNIYYLGNGAFEGCSSLCGTLNLPSQLQYIGERAFKLCEFSGELHLPENLEFIGLDAFYGAGRFVGGLKIPDKITKLYRSTFYSCFFSGNLDLNNVRSFEGENIFQYCGFSGELIIPEGVVSIPDRFIFSDFGKLSSVVFPSTLKEIGDFAFCYQPLSKVVSFPEGFQVIRERAFGGCSHIVGIELPSTIQTIQQDAFRDCYGISNIVCKSVEPPTVVSGAFTGVAKDNFTVEVPAQSVKRYQAEPGWSDFKRIAAHYDFSVSRERMRALNAAQERTYTLRAPAEYKWRIDSIPDWVTVTPASGTGKTDIIVSVSKMDPTSGKFEVNEGTYNQPNYQKYSGRNGAVIFKIDELGIDYTCSLEIEQYDSEYSDGEVIKKQSATVNHGIDIVFVGDGYDAKDIAKGTFDSNVQEGINAFFDIEPYKTYKEYFNVYAVVSQSDDSGIGTVNTVVDTKFGTYFTQNRIKVPASEPIFTWAKKADAGIDFTKALVINLLNTSAYEGICAMYADGSAIAFCPVSRDAYPYDFRGIIQHEAGGHGFGKLGDEYIYHNAFIQTCDCKDGCDHPKGDNDNYSSYGIFKSLGWYKNLSMNGDMHQVPWAHLIYNPQYSNYVDMYEGGYMHSRGVYRSEATSCMNNNIPYYSAISRQAMVERIMSITGEEFTLEKFYAKDKDDFGTIPATKSSATPINRTYGVDPLWNRGSEEGSVVYMGEHPDYSKIK